MQREMEEKIAAQPTVEIKKSMSQYKTEKLQKAISANVPGKTINDRKLHNVHAKLHKKLDVFHFEKK